MFIYELNSDKKTYTIASIDSALPSRLILPSQTDNNEVIKSISRGCFRDNLDIKELIIPNTITRIGKDAFRGCKNLEKVYFLGIVKFIDSSAFDHCNINMVILPTVGIISYSAFRKNPATIVITKKINKVFTAAFAGCKKIVCTLPNEIKNNWMKDWDVSVSEIANELNPEEQKELINYEDKLKEFGYVGESMNNDEMLKDNKLKGDKNEDLHESPESVVRKIFEERIDEIKTKKIIIKNIARVEGVKTKIAVQGLSKDVIPIKCCVGKDKIILNEITKKLNDLSGANEYIDIVEYDEAEEIYISNALKPADIIKVRRKNDESFDCVVKDNQFAKAVGQGGINVRLAGRLTGYKLNILKESEYVDDGLGDEVVDDTYIVNNQKKYEKDDKLASEISLLNLKNDEKFIRYTKYITVQIPVKFLKISNIPTYEGIQLSFYQKYIIYLLKHGVRAYSKDHLIVLLSEMLNVHTTLVGSFVKYLEERKFLILDGKNACYTLSDKFQYFTKPGFNDAMFARLDIVKVECNKICYSSLFNEFFDKNMLTSKCFRCVEKENPSSVLDDSEYDNIIKNLNKLSKKLSDVYANTNQYYQPDDCKDVKIDREILHERIYEFDVLLQYKFDRVLKESTLENYVVRKDNLLDSDLIKNICQKYKIDLDIPTFISLNEKFYKKAESIEQNISKNEDYQQKLIEEIKKIQEEKANKAINDLKIDRENLKQEIDKARSETNDVKAKMAEKEKEKDDEISELKAKLTEAQDKANKFETELSKVFNENKQFSDSLVAKVISKYENIKNIFGRRVCLILKSIDKALSASNSDCFEELQNSLFESREYYRQVFQALFQVLLDKKMMRFGDIFNKDYIFDMDRIFKKFHMTTNLKYDMRSLHNLFNAFVHLEENGPMKERNIETIKEFKNYSNGYRASILLSFPTFLNSVKLSNQEIEIINSNLNIDNII